VDAQSIPVIETERLILRGPVDADIDTWQGFLGDPDFGRYVPRRRVLPTPRERAERQMRVYLNRWDAHPHMATGWAVTRRMDNQFIGLCGVDLVADTNDGEIEYFIGQPYWGQGYAGEAAGAATRFALANTAMDRILAYVVPVNVASVRIVQRLGFVHERDVDYLELMGAPDLVLDPPIVAEYSLPRQR
jgi:RimJ/RimL family protein N-acetyltransferase